MFSALRYSNDLRHVPLRAFLVLQICCGTVRGPTVGSGNYVCARMQCLYSDAFLNVLNVLNVVLRACFPCAAGMF